MDTVTPASLSDSSSLFSDTKYSFSLRLCIADCNGHFRSWDTLALIWLEVSSYDPPLSYEQLNRRLGVKIGPKYSIDLPLVKAALLGVPVESTVQCPSTIHMYGDYLTMGSFFNTPAGIKEEFSNLGIVTDTSNQFVPRVSSFQLFTFADAFREAKGTEVC